MTDFPTLKRRCMDHYQQTILPLLQDGRPGHLWSGRLELRGMIERIDDWLNQNGPDFEAVMLRTDFALMPHARYTMEQCTEALKAETAKWRAV